MNFIDNEHIGLDPYRVFFELSAEGIWRLELEVPVSISLAEDDQMDALYRYGYFAECNDAMARMYGFSSAADFNGIRLSDLLPRTDPANIQALRDFIRSGYRLADSESHEVDKEGRALYFLNNLMGVIQEGHLVSVWGTQRNITAEKEAEEVLRRSEERYRATFNNAPLGIVYLGLDGNFSEVNRQFESILGYSQEELTNYTFRDLIHPEDFQTTVMHRGELLSGDIMVSAEDKRFRHKNGDYVWLHCRVSLLRDSEGRPSQLLSIAQDITERKKAEEKLRFQSHLLDSVGQAIIYADVDGAIRYWNYFAETLYGWTAQEAIGRQVSIVVPESLRSVALEIRSKNNAAQPVSTELTLQRKDGSTFPALVSTQPIHDSTGALIGTIGVSSDISPLKHVETSLRESEARFRTLADTVPQIVWVTRPDGWHEYYNGRWYDYTGLTPEESIGWGWSGPLHPEDKERSKKRWEEATSTGQPYEIEYRFRAADGSYRWFLGRALPIRNEEGEIARWFGTCTDIEEQKRMEASLRESEERFRNMADSSPVMIWVAESDGVCTYLNRLWSDFTGQSFEEGMGLGWLEVLHAEDKVRVGTAFKEANLHREPFHYEYRLRRKDGEYRWMLGAAAPRFGSDGNFLGYVGSVIDITQRREMEEALKQQGDRLRLALEIGQMGGWEWDAKKQRLLWHYNIDQVQGYPEGTFNGELSSFMEMVHPDDRQQMMEGLHRAYQETGWHTTAFRVIGADGQIRWNEGRFMSIKDDSGETSLLKGVSIDITERKKSEEALRQSEERFASFMDNLPAVAWIKDGAGFYTYVNSAFEKTLDKPLSEILGKKEHDLWPKEAADHAEASDRIVQKTLKPLETQEFSHYDGELCHTWVTKFPIQEKTGKAQIGGIAIDATERIRAEMRQASVLRGLKNLVEIADELLLAPDMDSLLLCAVERARERLNVERCSIYLLGPEEDIAWGTYGTDVQGETCDERDTGFSTSGNWIEAILKMDFTMPGTLRWFLAPNQSLYGRDSTLEDKRVLELGKTGWVAATPILSKNGPRGVLYNDTAISDTPVDVITQELLVIYCSLLGNLIERQEALDELKQSQQQVIRQERLRAVGEMSSGIAHDVNNSLAPIAGFAELLLTKTDYLSDVEKTKRYLSHILTSSQDAASTIGRLKEFYRHREDRDVMNRVDLDGLVAQVVEITQPKWKDQAQVEGKNIKVMMELNALPPIAGDEASLREALTNFIFNAVDAIAPPGGGITLTTRFDEGMKRVLLEIRDTGVGMDEATRARCLEPFFTTKGEKGTGLGLSVVYGIVQRHEGTMELESQVGGGTIFRLTFPISLLDKAASEEREEVALHGSLRVLLVEDEPLVGELMTVMLSEVGHAVRVAVDGEQGLKAFMEGEFDLVITDRAMPKLNGEQLVFAIKRVKPEMPVIMLTGFGEFMNATEECPAGVDVVLSKPVSLNDLAQAIRKVTQ